MATLTQGTGYAIQALSCVAAAAGKPQLIREIAESCDLPAPYLSKIVHRLSRVGLVKTQRGINGGVTLLREAVDITLLDVCRALDDPVIHPRCLLGVAECSDARACPAHAFNMEQRGKIIEFLRATTVADIAAFEMKRRWRLLATAGETSEPATSDGPSERTEGSEP
ncbi:MAG: Rrf2 family transcriptional regulator [Planctomycetota bacterium]